MKTSGADGIHVLVPIARRSTYEQTYEFAELVSRGLEARAPRARDDRVAEEASASGVLVDHRQNGARQDDRLGLLGAAEAGRAGLDAAALGGADREGDGRADFGMREALERVEQHGDLFEPVLQGGQALGLCPRSLRVRE